jgi:hypothetical protein
VVAIDYTASNGDPKYSGSLHYHNPYEPNEYVRAIRAVGDILADYDTDGKIPVFGFGAKMHNNTVSHCFNVNGQPNSEVIGIDGVLAAYQSSFTNGVIHSLYGPTNFSPVIKTCKEFAAGLHSNEKDVQSYLVLLIITDGEISDLNETIGEIVDSSYLPMSIVIVGVGQADFGKMDMLDSDTQLLRHGHKEAERDIVQFVPFREFKQRSNAELAAAVLAEIPDQFIQYMTKHRIAPHVVTPEQMHLFEQQAIQRNVSYIPDASHQQSVQRNVSYVPDASQQHSAVPLYPPQPNQYGTQIPAYPPTGGYQQVQPVPGQVPPTYQQGQYGTVPQQIPYPTGSDQAYHQSTVQGAYPPPNN